MPVASWKIWAIITSFISMLTVCGVIYVVANLFVISTTWTASLIILWIVLAVENYIMQGFRRRQKEELKELKELKDACEQLQELRDELITETQRQVGGSSGRN
jgi:sensor histidine kinase YesM